MRIAAPAAIRIPTAHASGFKGTVMAPWRAARLATYRSVLPDASARLAISA